MEQSLPDKLTFIHLSDLHITAKPHDLDGRLRNAVLQDLEGLLPTIRPVTGVLVTGDTVNAGKAEQFDKAREWLKKVCGAVDCPPSAVWTVPGNHDVDREKSNKSILIKNLQQQFRPTRESLSSTQINQKVREILEDDEAARILFQPLEAYNNFAASYGLECTTSPDNIAWKKDFTLNDGSCLRLFGLNSALISNRHDDAHYNRLIVSEYQLPENEKGVIVLVLCHHPPDWLHDRKHVRKVLNAVSSIQLFGHEHEQHVDKGQEAIRLYAGALHPSRDEPGWNPRYNVIQLAVKGTGNDRVLHVNTWPREWESREQKFVPARPTHGDKPDETLLQLKEWTAPKEDAQAAVKPSDRDAQEDSDTGSEAQTLKQPSCPMNPLRQAIYDYFELPYTKRVEILNDLGLLEEDDHGTSERETLRHVVQRIKQRQLIDQFHSTIREHLSHHRQS